MKKHYFLGTGAHFTKAERREFRKIKGSHQDLLNLYQYFYENYDGEQSIVTKNGRTAIAAALENYVYLFKRNLNRGEVIVNGLTCHAVVQGVKAAGFTPVFADIDPSSLNFTQESLEKVATEKTKAIIVQNTLGNMVDMKMVEKFAKKHKLTIIEDLAHCVGRFYPDGREAGKVGEVVVFSFGKEKSIDTITGGAVVFRNPEIFLVEVPQDAPERGVEKRARMYPTLGSMYRKLSYLALHGIFMRFLLRFGLVKRSADGDINFDERLSDFQAKIALKQLTRKNKLRLKPLREFYLVRDRKKTLEKLKKAGYYFDGAWYERPVGPERYYKEAKFPEKACPNAVYVAKHIINLPNYYSEKELKRAREIIEEDRDER